MKKLFIFFLCILFNLQFAFGQEVTLNTQDWVYTYTGNVYKGEIIEFVRGDYLVIKIKDGDITLLEKDIRKIVQKKSKYSPKSVYSNYKFREYGFKEEGFYMSFDFATLSGSEFGSGVSAGFGFMKNRLFGFGLGLGADVLKFDSFQFDQGFQDTELVYPVFGEVRGYFFENWASPYYNFRAGYAFAIPNESRDLIKASGGLFVNPGIGIRTGGRKGINMIYEVGYRFQEASFKWEDSNTSDIINRDVKYNRLVVKVGMVF